MLEWSFSDIFDKQVQLMQPSAIPSLADQMIQNPINVINAAHTTQQHIPNASTRRATATYSPTRREQFRALRERWSSENLSQHHKKEKTSEKEHTRWLFDTSNSTAQLFYVEENTTYQNDALFVSKIHKSKAKSNKLHRWCREIVTRRLKTATPSEHTRRSSFRILLRLTICLPKCTVSREKPISSAPLHHDQPHKRPTHTSLLPAHTDTQLFVKSLISPYQNRLSHMHVHNSFWTGAELHFPRWKASFCPQAVFYCVVNRESSSDLDLQTYVRLT